MRLFRRKIIEIDGRVIYIPSRVSRLMQRFIVWLAIKKGVKQGA